MVTASAPAPIRCSISRNSLEKLTGILTHGFRPSFSVEDFSTVIGSAMADPNSQFGVPMVCFCDIPLSQASHHMATYGRYGIGVSKKWGILHGVSPVMYLVPGTATAEAFLNALTPDHEIEGHVRRLISFTKPYEGVLHSTGKSVRFYDEREWRYVPAEEGGGARILVLDRLAEYVAQTESRQYGAVMNGPGGDDLRYIIVANDQEILPLIKAIESIGSAALSVDEMKLICSRIISSDQVNEDF